MKIVISDAKSGKSFQAEVEKGKEASLVGLKIGDVIDGGIAGASGYKLKITGGSDKDGVPMRGDVAGAKKDRLLLSRGPGFRPSSKGERMRKAVRGNVVSAEIAQLNTIVVERGERPLEEIFASREKKEEKK